MGHHGGHQIQTSIQTTRHPSTRDDPQPTQPHIRPPRNTLPPLNTLLPRITPLSRDGLPPPIRPLTQDERILLELLAQLKPRVVDYIVLLHDVRLFEVPAACRVFAQDLQLGVVVWVGGCSEALENTCLGEEEGRRADGEEGALFAWVASLEGGERAD